MNIEHRFGNIQELPISGQDICAVSDEVQNILHIDGALSDDQDSQVDFQLSGQDYVARIHFVASARRIFISTNLTYTEGTTFRIDLDEDGQPIKLIIIDDKNNLLPGLLDSMGCTQIAKLIGFKNGASDVLADKLVAQNALLNKVRELRSKQPVVISEVYSGKFAFFVNQDAVKVSPVSEAIETGGLDPCSALVFIDDQKEQHGLFHIDAGTSKKRIEKFIAENDPAHWYVLPGISAIATLMNIISVFDFVNLDFDLLELDSFKFLPGLVVSNGDLFLQSD